MIYGIIQFIYIAGFAILFEKMGFRWKWFLPLAFAFIAATVLTILLSSKGLLASIASTEPEQRLQILTIPMYIFFCPIHAFITVRVMNAIPKDAPHFHRIIVKVLVYAAAALAAGFIFAVLMMLAMVAYTLVTG